MICYVFLITTRTVPGKKQQIETTAISRERRAKVMNSMANASRRMKIDASQD